MPLTPPPTADTRGRRRPSYCMRRLRRRAVCTIESCVRLRPGSALRRAASARLSCAKGRPWPCLSGGSAAEEGVPSAPFLPSIASRRALPPLVFLPMKLLQSRSLDLYYIVRLYMDLRDNPQKHIGATPTAAVLLAWDQDPDTSYRILPVSRGFGVRGRSTSRRPRKGGGFPLAAWSAAVRVPSRGVRIGPLDRSRVCVPGLLCGPRGRTEYVRLPSPH